MNEENPKPPVVEATPPRPSEPLPPHPAFATVVKTHHSRQQVWIAVLLVVLIGGIFTTYAWQHQKVSTLTVQKLAADQAVDRLNNQIVPLLAAAKTTPTAGSASLNVFKIPELGIELSVPASLSTLTYLYETTDSGKVAKLSTSTLGALDAGCKQSTTEDTGADPALGTLYRANGTGHSSSGFVVEKQYATYYIGYTPPQSVCATTATINAVLPLQLADFKASLSTIQPLQ